jgi:methionine sulfoxide reductase catalytic subunit
MNIIHRKGWEIPERDATPEDLFLNRRNLMKGAAAIGAGALLPAGAFAQGKGDPSAGLYPAPRNELYKLDRPLTAEKITSNYNNFYEFGSTKFIADAAQRLQTRPWTIKFDGLVEKPREVDIDTLLKAVKLEERLYRLRCVEAWSMTIPWTGFPMKQLLDFARPLSGAKYVRMETFMDPKVAPAQRQIWYPWPFVDGCTIEEAANDLAFMVTGAYGKPLANQFGAPIRIHMPWKYGFKAVKSITRISFVADRPKGFWEAMQPAEYGFWANVNPEVTHPRWSQATEEVLGTRERVPTLLFNGYGEFVADLYKGKENERLWA